MSLQCQDIQKNCSNIQSNVDKSKKILSLVDFNNSNSIESVYVLNDEFDKLDKSHSVVHKEIFTNSHPVHNEMMRVNFDYTKNRYHDKYGFNFSCQSPERTLKIIFNLLLLAAEHGGYTYGGFVRDVLVPRFIFNQEHASRNEFINYENISSSVSIPIQFKDVDIWFRSLAHIKNFVNQLNNTNGVYRLKKNDHSSFSNDGGRNETYGVDFRQQYILYFCDMEIAYIDLVASKFLPVNDFCVNLLTFIPRESDFINITRHWFKVEQNKDNDSSLYDVDPVIDYILERSANILTGYIKNVNNKNDIKHMKTIANMRIKRFKEWGWKLENENQIPINQSNNLNDDDI